MGVCRCGKPAIGREGDGYSIIEVCEEHAWEGLAKAKAGENAYGINIWWERYKE